MHATHHAKHAAIAHAAVMRAGRLVRGAFLAVALAAAAALHFRHGTIALGIWDVTMRHPAIKSNR